MWKGNLNVSFASTTKSTSENLDDANQVIDKSKENKNSVYSLKFELLNLLRVEISKKKLNEYIYEEELINKFLPHLKIDLGRRGKKYLK